MDPTGGGSESEGDGKVMADRSRRGSQDSQEEAWQGEQDHPGEQENERCMRMP